MAKVIVDGDDKIYRSLYLKAEGFNDSLEYEWQERAQNLTGAQELTIKKLANSDWLIEIDENGIATLVLK